MECYRKCYTSVLQRPGAINESWTVTEPYIFFRWGENKREACCCKGEEAQEEGFSGRFVVARKKRLERGDLGERRREIQGKRKKISSNFF